MGMYCSCGVKKRDEWICQCNWEGWYLCFPCEDKPFPKDIPIKQYPDFDGIYEVRVFEDGDDYEDVSEYSIQEKNWGELTNEKISRWKIEYDDGWMGYCGVYAWKEKK